MTFSDLFSCYDSGLALFTSSLLSNKTPGNKKKGLHPDSNLKQFLPEKYAKFFETEDEKRSQPSLNNSLDLGRGEYKYLHNINLPKDFCWTGGDYQFKDLGAIGRFEQGNEGHKNVIEDLQSLLNSLDKLQSYSIFFVVQSGNSYLTLDRQYLINHDSGVQDIMASIFERIVILSLKYGINFDDRLGCKYRPLAIKVKNPIFDYHKVPPQMWKH